MEWRRPSRPQQGAPPIVRRLLALAGALIALPAAATTILPIADGTLVDRAPIVVEATVEAGASTASASPATEWRVAVGRVLKGSLSADRIVVRVPGGHSADGRTLMVYGAPPLRPGSRAIFLLSPRPDGTFGISDFPQGAFVELQTPRRRLAYRDFSRVRTLGAESAGTPDSLRDFDRFGIWIADRVAGFERAPDYAVTAEPEELEAISAEYVLLSAGSRNLRWFDFDTGGVLSYLLAGTPPADLSAGGTGEVQRALAAWTNEATTPIRLALGGATPTSGGLQTSDRKNVIVWGDPNDEMPGAFSCAVAGGTLAIGGPWYRSDSPVNFGCVAFDPIVEGDVVVNDGIECMRSFSPSFSKLIEEMVGHEIGHTLGLDHSSENPQERNSLLKSALMYYRMHDDRRGARLNSDDIAAIRYLYTREGVSELPGDADRNDRVDGVDLVLLARAFGSRSGEARFSAAVDFDGNKRVDGTDLALLAANFARSCA